MSEIMQFGLGLSSWNNFSAGCCSREAAAMKLKTKSWEGSMSRFSHPSGNPVSSHGKLSWITRIWSPESMARERTVSKRAALYGVVIMVIMMPR